MEYTLEQQASLIITECEKHNETDPYIIFRSIARMHFVMIHGPEHHILDGACILTAFKNAGGYDVLPRETAYYKLMTFAYHTQ